MSLFSRKRNIGEKIADEGKKLEPELKELVIGRKTVLSLLSFTVGSVLIGNVLYGMLINAYGGVGTVLMGLVLFVVGGLVRKEFRK